MAEDKRKALAFAIAEYLTEELEHSSEDAKESLEVAVQCLESVYGFETGDEEAKAMYSIKPASLLSVFESGRAAPQKTDSNSASHMYGTGAKAHQQGHTEDYPKEVPEGDRQRADNLKDQGNEAVKNGDYNKALDLYSAAIAINPNNAIYRVNRAAAYTKLKQLDKAIEDCEAGIRIDPNYSKAYSRLGTCYFSLQDYAPAVEAYQKALMLEPNNKSYADNLRAAETRRQQSGGMNTSTTPRSSGPPGGGLGGFGGLGGAGGGMGGEPDMGALLNNPALMSMAQQFLQSGGMQQMMNSQAFQNMAANVMQRNQGGSGPGLSEMLNDPAIQNAAQELQKQYAQQPPRNPM